MSASDDLLQVLREIVVRESERLNERSKHGGLSDDDWKTIFTIARVAKLTAGAKTEEDPGDGELTDEEVAALAAKAKQNA